MQPKLASLSLSPPRSRPATQPSLIDKKSLLGWPGQPRPARADIMLEPTWSSGVMGKIMAEAEIKVNSTAKQRSSSHYGAKTPYGVTTNGLETAKCRS